MRQILLLLAFFSFLSNSSATDYYWIGGAGNWNQLTHWATSSGGSVNHTILPGANDDVYVDSNSAAGGFVGFITIVDSGRCRNFYHKNEIPAGLNGSSVTATLIVHGSFIIGPGMVSSTLSNPLRIDLYGDLANDSLDTKNNDFLAATFRIWGSYALMDSIRARAIDIRSDSFNSNGFTIRARDRLYLVHSSNPAVIRLDSSDIYSPFINRKTSTATISFLGTRFFTSSFFSSSKLNRVPFVSGSPSFDAAGTVFERVLGGYFRIDIESADTFEYLIARGTVKFKADAVFDTLIIDTRYLRTHELSAGVNITINDSFSLFTNPCFPLNLLTSISGISATITLPSGTDLNTDFVNIKDITATGGGNFNVGANSTDLGGNSGVNFSGPLYNLHLLVSNFCIDSGQLNIVEVASSGLPTEFWWKDLNTAPFDTFNRNIDSIHAYSQSSFEFIANYGANCLIRDTVHIYLKNPASGIAQDYINLASDSSWFNCSNWSSNLIPDSLSDVQILSSNKLLISNDTAYCKNLLNNGDLEITGGVLMVYGDFDNQGSVTHTGGEIHFAGTDSTVIKGNALTFDTMVVNKYNGGSLHNLVSNLVRKRLELTNGIVFTGASREIIISDNASSSEGSATSYIDGPMSKIGNDAFVFPTGDNGVWARCAISAPNLFFSRVRAEYHAAAYTDTSNYNLPLKKVSQVEYWDITRVLGSMTIKVSLYFEDSLRSGIKNSDSSVLSVAHYNGSSWDDAGSDFDSLANGKGYITSGFISNFSPFTFGSKDLSNPVPVDWLSFDAQWKDKNASLNWSTASEENNDFFEVQRRSEQGEFETIAKIQSKANNGFSNSILKYDYIDPSAASLNLDKLFYRIKQTDYDGTIDYSMIQFLSLEQKNEFILSPNPNNGKFHLKLPSEAHEISIYNHLGQRVFHQQNIETSLELDLAELRKGHYYVELKSPYKIFRKSMIIK